MDVRFSWKMYRKSPLDILTALSMKAATILAVVIGLLSKCVLSSNRTLQIKHKVSVLNVLYFILCSDSHRHLDVLHIFMYVTYVSLEEHI